MPKPSGTNSPRASNTNSETRLYQGVSLSATYALPAETKAGRRYCGGNSSGDPPLPIPNREVKPARAYDTAIPSGKVGSRQFLRPSGSSDSGGLFFVLRKRTKSPPRVNALSCRTRRGKILGINAACAAEMHTLCVGLTALLSLHDRLL